jgi:hypothetical protein
MEYDVNCTFRMPWKHEMPSAHTGTVAMSYLGQGESSMHCCSAGRTVSPSAKRSVDMLTACRARHGSILRKKQ